MAHASPALSFDRDQNPLNERLGIDVPIIQATMGWATWPPLAAAVSGAGGLGMLALTQYDDADVPLPDS